MALILSMLLWRKLHVVSAQTLLTPEDVAGGGEVPLAINPVCKIILRDVRRMRGGR